MTSFLNKGSIEVVALRIGEEDTLTSQQSIGVALEVSRTFKFSAKLVLIVGTL